MTHDPSTNSGAAGKHSRWLAGWAMDLRSLAIFRILLGCAVLYGAWHRAQLIEPFFSDAGVLPAEEAARGHVYHWWHFSLFLWFHSPTATAVLFGLTACAGLLFAIGWRTWWMNLACWIAIGSIQARNPLILHAGDTLEILLLFWGLFLPLGSRFSLDAKRARPPGEIVSIGTAGLIGQALVIYWIAGITKLQSPAWLDGSYLEALLQANPSPVQQLIAKFPGCGRALTYATLLIEFVAPLLLISPWRRDLCRTCAIVSLAGLQFGIAMALPLGTFPLLNVAHLAALIPAVWYGKAQAVGEREDLPRFVLYARAALGCAAFALILVWNIVGLLRMARPSWAKTPISALRLQQQWHVFTHDPDLRTWVATPAQTQSGKVIDLARMGAPFNLKGYPTDSLMQADYRWRLFLGGNLVPADPPFAKSLGSRLLIFLVKEWTAAHPAEPIKEAVLLRCWSKKDSGVKSEQIAQWGLSGEPPAKDAANP